MNGVHDVGGLQGFGPVRPEAGEPVFHHDWEKRVLALHVGLLLAGSWPIDEWRYARETLPPAEYLSSSYYETVLAGLEHLAVTHELLSSDELASGRSLRPGGPPPSPLRPDAVAHSVQQGTPSLRQSLRPARFAIGQSVRAKNINPVTHTRLPRYARSHVGVIESVHGCHAFPDARAHGAGDDPQWLYTVRFTSEELWGADADPTLSVSIDAFEPYLEETRDG